MLYIPFSYYQQNVGGPTTFLTNFKKYLITKKIPYQSDSDENTQTIFFPISFDLATLEMLKKRNVRIIQRLDGIYYPSKHGADYQHLNSEIEAIYRHYSDIIIFQSEYSKKQCFSLFGEKKSCHIIINGVDKDIFYPASKQNHNHSIRLITTGNFRNLDMLVPIVHALDKLKDTFNFTLKILGPIAHKELLPYLKRTYIEHLDQVPLHAVAQYLRDSDVFIYSHLNPPCPNSVLEAISVGLPVVGFASGAMQELLTWQEDLLALVSDEVFQRYEDFNAAKFADKMSLCFQNLMFFRERALAHSHLYSFDECGRRYVDILTSQV